MTCLRTRNAIQDHSMSAKHAAASEQQLKATPAEVLWPRKKPGAFKRAIAITIDVTNSIGVVTALRLKQASRPKGR